jgi:hypothetical protein
LCYADVSSICWGRTSNLSARKKRFTGRLTNIVVPHAKLAKLWSERKQKALKESLQIVTEQKGIAAYFLDDTNVLTDIEICALLVCRNLILCSGKKNIFLNFFGSGVRRYGTCFSEQRFCRISLISKLCSGVA